MPRRPDEIHGCPPRTGCPNCQAWQEAHDAQVSNAMRDQMGLEDKLLRCAQALRYLRDTHPGHVENVAARALREADIEDPEDEDHDL